MSMKLIIFGITVLSIAVAFYTGWLAGGSSAYKSIKHASRIELPIPSFAYGDSMKLEEIIISSPTNVDSGNVWLDFESGQLRSLACGNLAMKFKGGIPTIAVLKSTSEKQDTTLMYRSNGTLDAIGLGAGTISDVYQEYGLDGEPLKRSTLMRGTGYLIRQHANGMFDTTELKDGEIVVRFKSFEGRIPVRSLSP